VLSRPARISDDELRETLAGHWGIVVAELEYRPVGFGSHHWDARAAGGDSWFVTVDEVGRDPGPLRAALATAVELRAAGCAFVVAPIPTHTNEPFARMGDYAVALYPRIEGRHFVGGEFATEEHRRATLDLVVALHRQPRASAPAAREDNFAILCRADLEAGLAGRAPDGTGPYARDVSDLLDRQGAAISAALAHYDSLAARVEAGARPRVISHGEPHAANTIATPHGLVLIDWDTVLIAPPERDLWSVDTGDGRMLEAYADATGVEPAADALALYGLGWDLHDIAAYTRRLRRPHEGSEDDEKSWHGMGASIARLASESSGWSW
jgi:spectinomycin phosphotransferase/16S rRNA (guanine(1405)-N(7))-methyltransferase